jgi:S-adenosylmethionine:tRNA ribosyltransferase-isomerase
MYVFMLTKDLNFDLPEKLIAQFPTEQRDHSRLLVFNRSTQSLSHHYFYELPELLPSNLSILRNNVAVLKARLFGRRPSGGIVECLLLKEHASSKLVWKCLIKPGYKAAKSKIFGIENEYTAEILESLPSGEYIVKFNLSKDADPTELAQRMGSIPLPPYIQRQSKKEDEERYQTIYANNKNTSAIAAPTAGLHFTNKIFEDLVKKGHQIFDLTLSVGLGTFRPIGSEEVEDHVMHSEEYSITPLTKSILRNKKITRLAIGTTCVRAIEHYLKNDDQDMEKSVKTESNLFIRPPFNFLGVDHLLTNFHLPGSTLLCLVGAFLSPSESDGIEKLKEIYKEAIKMNYRFFSYGDSMLIL